MVSPAGASKDHRFIDGNPAEQVPFPRSYTTPGNLPMSYGDTMGHTTNTN